MRGIWMVGAAKANDANATTATANNESGRMFALNLETRGILNFNS